MTGTVLAYQLEHGTAVRLGGFLQFAAALPLAIWAATVHGWLRTLGVLAVGTTMALVGGVLASASLALGGLIGWTSAETAHLHDPAITSLVIAAIGMLSTATLLTLTLGLTVPVVRFGGLIWLLAVSALLTHTRPRRVNA